MNIELLSKLDEAPSAGQMLIYRRSDVKFDSYINLDAVRKLLEESKDVLEIHLFDAEKEYRALRSQSKRFSSGWIEHVATYKEDKLTVYTDYTVLDSAEYKGMKMKVLNKVSYGATGMAYIDDYRLVMEEK